MNFCILRGELLLTSLDNGGVLKYELLVNGRIKRSYPNLKKNLKKTIIFYICEVFLKWTVLLKTSGLEKF